MALVKIDESTLVQKLKRLVLGNEKPNFITRFSVIIGFGFWLYFTLWQVLIFLSIILVDRLQNPEMITNTFNRIGYKYAFLHRWGIDTANTLLIHSIIILGLYALSLLGLIFIYRKKKTGYLFYLLGNGLSIIFTIFFLGISYFNEQISLIDKIIFSAITAYFLLGFFIFKTSVKIKQKKIKN